MKSQKNIREAKPKMNNELANLLKSAQEEEKTDTSLSEDVNVLNKPKLDTKNDNNGFDEAHWENVMKLANEYKAQPASLSNVYIDGELKKIIDMLKTSVEGGRLPSTAILSAIIKDFVKTNQKKLEQTIYGKKLF